MRTEGSFKIAATAFATLVFNSILYLQTKRNSLFDLFAIANFVVNKIYSHLRFSFLSSRLVFIFDPEASRRNIPNNFSCSSYKLGSIKSVSVSHITKFDNSLEIN